VEVGEGGSKVGVGVAVGIGVTASSGVGVGAQAAGERIAPNVSNKSHKLIVLIVRTLSNRSY